jgi:hypothetical protein
VTGTKIFIEEAKEMICLPTAQVWMMMMDSEEEKGERAEEGSLCSSATTLEANSVVNEHPKNVMISAEPESSKSQSIHSGNVLVHLPLLLALPLCAIEAIFDRSTSFAASMLIMGWTPVRTVKSFIK